MADLLDDTIFLSVPPNTPTAKKPNKAQEKRDSVRQFWKEHKEECLPIKSIKEVFAKYKTYCEEKQLQVQNEYIFRTFIRKNGYNNSGEKKKKNKKTKEEKKLAKLLKKSQKIADKITSKKQ